MLLAPYKIRKHYRTLCAAANRNHSHWADDFWIIFIPLFIFNQWSMSKLICSESMTGIKPEYFLTSLFVRAYFAFLMCEFYLSFQIWNTNHKEMKFVDANLYFCRNFTIISNSKANEAVIAIEYYQCQWKSIQSLINLVCVCTCRYIHIAH